MPAFIRAQVVLPFKTGLPEDVATNTFHFESDTLDFAAAIAPIPGYLAAFYQAFATRLSGSIAKNLVHVNLYNMLTPAPRVPVTVVLGITGSDGTSGLPNEVSVCLSTRGALPNLPSRRGRVFIGPLLNSTAILSFENNVPRVNSAFRNDLLLAAQNLGLALGAGGGTRRWVVYSPTNLTTIQVVHAWIDDDFDTQRRRQVRTLIRTQGAINQA